MSSSKPATQRLRLSGLIAVFVAVAGSASISLPQRSHAASFDCNAQGLAADEKTICDNRTLNDDDVKMVTTFDLLSGLLAMGSRGTLQDEQTAWLKTRQACGADAACIAKAYQTRLDQLKDTYDHLNRPL